MLVFSSFTIKKHFEFDWNSRPFYARVAFHLQFAEVTYFYTYFLLVFFPFTQPFPITSFIYLFFSSPSFLSIIVTIIASLFTIFPSFYVLTITSFILSFDLAFFVIVSFHSRIFSFLYLTTSFSSFISHEIF